MSRFTDRENYKDDYQKTALSQCTVLTSLDYVRKPGLPDSFYALMVKITVMCVTNSLRCLVFIKLIIL